jgi:hypothetical protein
MFGPQVESTVNVTKHWNKENVISIPVGGAFNVVYGPADTLGLFLGYESIHSARKFVVQEATATKPEITEDRGLVGMLTYIHTW